MNLETLLEAAKFVELQEVKQKKALESNDARGKLRSCDFLLF